MRLLIGLMCLVLLIGCKSGPSLVGQWGGSYKGIPGKFEFRPDSTFTFSGGVSDSAKGQIDGTYKVDGENFTITYNSVAVELPEPFKSMAEKSLQDGKGKPLTGTIEFASEDQVNVKAEGFETTLNRIKENG